ncbi:MAG: MinD/ParA family protein [Aquificae bacterium]|nr:MinD/ParA family protein [Aquificota bacterium]
MKTDQQLSLLSLREGRDLKTTYISISSGKGGVGKTLVAINLGEILSESGKRVLIFDGDLGLSNVHLMYGISPSKDLSDFIRGFATIDELPVEVSKNLFFISGGSGFQSLADLPKTQLTNLLLKLHEFAEENFHYVIIDTPPGIHKTTVLLASSANIPIVITTPEPTAIMDAYALIKVINKQEGVRDFYVIVNKADNSAEARTVAESLELLAVRYTSARLNYIGYVRYRKNLIRRVIDQSPVDRGFKEELREAVSNLNLDVRAREGFWSKILKKLGV